jgi:flagellar FliJ protein
MARFSFRLQSYLSLKEKMEDLRKQEYARAKRDLESEIRSLEALETEKAQCMGLFRATIAPGKKALDASELSRYNLYLERVATLIIKQTKRVSLAEAEAEKRRHALAEAMKDRKMLDTLKDNAIIEHGKETLAAEQKAADELVSFRGSAK